jgi:hypothetical protein
MDWVIENNVPACQSPKHMPGSCCERNLLLILSSGQPSRRCASALSPRTTHDQVRPSRASNRKTVRQSGSSTRRCFDPAWTTRTTSSDCHAVPFARVTQDCPWSSRSVTPSMPQHSNAVTWGGLRIPAHVLFGSEKDAVIWEFQRVLKHKV